MRSKRGEQKNEKKIKRDMSQVGVEDEGEEGGELE